MYPVCNVPCVQCIRCAVSPRITITAALSSTLNACTRSKHNINTKQLLACICIFCTLGNFIFFYSSSLFSNLCKAAVEFLTTHALSVLQGTLQIAGYSLVSTSANRLAALILSMRAVCKAMLGLIWRPD
jgi:hypothetical protein